MRLCSRRRAAGGVEHNNERAQPGKLQCNSLQTEAQLSATTGESRGTGRISGSYDSISERALWSSAGVSSSIPRSLPSNGQIGNSIQLVELDCRRRPRVHPAPWLKTRVGDFACIEKVSRWLLSCHHFEIGDKKRVYRDSGHAARIAKPHQRWSSPAR
jgi:hypothetical protein